MQILRHTIPVLVFSAILGLPFTAIGMAAHHEGDKATAENVQEDTAEAFAALKDYSVAQRNEALQAAKSQLDQLDVRIDRLQRNLDRHWQELSQTARKNQQDALQSLREKRNDVAEWYGGLRHSSATAWDKVKQGFADSYDRLETALANARKEFDGPNTGSEKPSE